jgi:hypothetical protein
LINQALAIVGEYDLNCQYNNGKREVDSNYIFDIRFECINNIFNITISKPNMKFICMLQSNEEHCRNNPEDYPLMNKIIERIMLKGDYSSFYIMCKKYNRVSFMNKIS